MNNTATKTQEKTIYIYYFDNTDDGRVKNIMAIVSNVVAQERPTALYFLLSSHGGQVDAGITLYNFLKSLPQKIIMHNIGTIDSIANVIFAARQKKYAVPHATFMFHGVTWEIKTQARISLPQLSEIRDRIEKNHNTIAGIICGNTKMKEEEIKRLFREGETLNVESALEKGIINQVKPAQLPKDALFISININN